MYRSGSKHGPYCVAVCLLTPVPYLRGVCDNPIFFYVSRNLAMSGRFLTKQSIEEQKVCAILMVQARLTRTSLQKLPVI